MSGSIRTHDHSIHEPITTRSGRTICVLGGEPLQPAPSRVAPAPPASVAEPVEPDPYVRSYNPDDDPLPGEEIVELPPLRVVPDPEDPVDPHTIVRTTDPETSKASAKMNPGKRGTQRYRVASALLSAYPSFLDFEDVAELAKLDPWQATKRISELKNTGFIEARGERRKRATAANRTTWILTEAGLANMRARARADE